MRLLRLPSEVSAAARAMRCWVGWERRALGGWAVAGALRSSGCLAGMMRLILRPAPWSGVRHLKLIQEIRTAETLRTQRFLHILCALCASHLGEQNHPKVEHSLSITPRCLALPISAWGIDEHAMHQLPGCRDVDEPAKP